MDVFSDRNGEYEPKIIGKYSRNADGMEEKILALYACGMSQRDISEQIKNLYDVEISDGLVSKIVGMFGVLKEGYGFKHFLTREKRT